MTRKQFTYLPTALSHDFDWVHMHWAAQWLYVTIQQSAAEIIPSVYRWNPRGLQVQAQALTEDMVDAAAEELTVAGFLMVDEAAGECHLRTFLDYDSLVKYPNTLVGLANNLSLVASWDIRSAVVVKLRALREKFPDLSGWSRAQVAQIMVASYEVPEHAWIDSKSRGVIPFDRTPDGDKISPETGG